ncbi:hypothetical protein Taro_011106 [Colocasia esculenta]|uniref:RNase H type-1 domain-containing protein n=1 Tax=Colocasia esculenta TaxID=4460 RepID=A0A843U5E6_COLES|nr:hypothetical protein [Colocasia esculenta]
MCGAGGCCIRNATGDVQLAFSCHYGTGNSLLAEVRALCDRLRLADLYGYRVHVNYSDSKALVQSLIKGVCPVWKCLWWWWKSKDHIAKTRAEIIHVYKESNKVADNLATYACMGDEDSDFQLELRDVDSGIWEFHLRLINQGTWIPNSSDLDNNSAQMKPLPSFAFYFWRMWN